MEQDKDDLYDVIHGHNYRANVMWCLWDGDRMRPIEIADEQGYRRQRVSEALRALEAHGLVECVNPNGAEKARWYQITELGREVWFPPQD